MADPSPLLPPSSPISDDLENKPRKTLDDTIEQCIGDCGISQSILALLIGFAWFFDAQQTFIAVFSDAHPSWHCADNTTCTVDRCLLPSSWSWDRPAQSSVVSEWSLDCRGPAVVGLPASSFFAGCLVGGLLLSTLADSHLGRKTMLVLTCLGMSLAGSLTALSPNVWIYAALRFVTGFFRATIGTSSLVLSSEVVGKRIRGQVAIVGFFVFTLGFLSLPVIAFLCRDSSWRYLYLWTSTPGLIYSILAYFFVVESPRWLAVRGRRQEAIKTLTDMALSNGHGSVIYSSFSGVPVYESEQGANSLGPFSAMQKLFERCWSLKRMMLIMTMGFGIGMLYYGMPLAVGDLGANLYWSVAINALAELPSSVVTSLLVHRINRRATALAFTWGSSVTSFLCVVLAEAKAARMAAEVVAFFCACTAFNVAMIYGLELFPTCVRNSAVAMLRQSVVLGGVLAPVLVAAGRDGEGIVTFTVFGVVVGVCGSFALFLPETRGEEICDTMEEQEQRDLARRTNLPVLS